MKKFISFSFVLFTMLGMGAAVAETWEQCATECQETLAGEDAICEESGVEGCREGVLKRYRSCKALCEPLKE